MDFKTEFLTACFSGGSPAHTVRAMFDGQADTVEYSAYMLPLLASDPATVYVTDSETGEILYWR